jgi:hypothetical protein
MFLDENVSPCPLVVAMSLADNRSLYKKGKGEKSATVQYRSLEVLCIEYGSEEINLNFKLS